MAIPSLTPPMPPVTPLSGRELSAEELGQMDPAARARYLAQRKKKPPGETPELPGSPLSASMGPG